MPEYLFLRLPASADGRYEYALTAPAGGVPGQCATGSAEELRALGTARRCIVVVPGYEALVTRVRLPTRRRSRIVQALPYALEEQLTSDVEALHFAIRRVDGDGGVHVAVVEHTAMQQWQSELQGLGIEPLAMVPESALLPADTQCWQVIADAQWAVMALGAEGAALEAATAPLVLEAALAETPEVPQRLKIAAPAGVRERLEVAATVLEEPPEVSVTDDDRPLLLRLAEQFDLAKAVNLLQGPYAQGERWGWVWRPLQPAAALLAAWLLVQGVLLIVEVQRLEAEQEALREEIAAVYQGVFPDGRIVNPRVQMEQYLRTIQRSAREDEGRPLTWLLAAAAPALAAEGLDLRNLRLQDQALEVDLDTADIESLEQLRAALESRDGLQVEIRSATAREGRVAGRLVIREATS
ncbi:type II secretion system protein GspL [Halorhodospira abdelmalekii]|uniref:type II secretion system protein GspL n=1 Tax=Halorhodospira abdelmalekii TaxID=421629 RepID=UPI001903AF64|nr:type II secretion system protein GspL [Halorhodospira abdelmalekii]MBK1734190.1 type II secretion system protein GspL [Halorhodospira abdelmalekii]